MANPVYKFLFKKSSTFFLCSVMMAFGLESFVNLTADAIYHSTNRGLLWEHIRENYKKAE